MSAKSLSGHLGAMLTVAVLIAGCGSSSKSDSTSQPASSPSSSTSTPSTSTPSASTPGGTSSEIVKGAEAKCLEALKKVPAGPARQTGEAACKAIRTQDASGLKARLRKQCLAFAQKAPTGAVRRQAEAACAKL
ncbi:MAG: hypothetical protein ACR2K9_01855 [Solirubrobacteraceae bacterium]